MSARVQLVSRYVDWNKHMYVCMRCAANEMWVKVGLRNPNRFAVKRHAETAHECNSALRKLLDSQEREILSITNNLIEFGFCMAYIAREMHFAIWKLRHQNRLQCDFDLFR